MAFFTSAVKAFSAAAREDSNALISITVTALCILIPMDLSQLVFAILGACAYYIWRILQRAAKQHKGPKGPKENKAAPEHLPIRRQPAADCKLTGADLPPRYRAPQARGHPVQKHWTAPSPVVQVRTVGSKTTSSAPVTAPTFQGVGLEAEAQELLTQIMPTPESDRIVDRLAEAIKYFLASTMPEAEVLGFASGDLSRRKAFGVAVPDVDIVINIDPAALAQRLANRTKGKTPANADLDARKLQKTAIRVCTDKLVSAGGFKFRRSAFRGNEPKVTLLAPAELGIFGEAVPIDLSVNTVAPLHSAALLTECGQIDMRTKELLVLVRRWAKDRGICHHPKGHFSPYIWSLLSIYFLQVGDREEGPLLPQLDGFEATSNLMAHKAAAGSKVNGAVPASQRTKWRSSCSDATLKQSAAGLLRSFMKFYAEEFDWKQEAVCVRLGKRVAPALTLPIHIIMDDSSKSTQVGPSVEDAFEPTNNLGACMTSWSFQRMKEELSRANNILSNESASLSTLLEPWTPPASEGVEAEGDEN